MLTKKLTLKPIVIAGAAVFALLAAPLAVDLVWDDLNGGPVAMADEGGPPAGKGHMGKGGEAGGGGRPEGKGGPGGSAKGPPSVDDPWGREASDYWKEHSTWPPIPQGKEGATGGRPIWGGMELTDIGRLNVARAPDSVLNRAETNSLAELGSNFDFYNLALPAVKGTPLTADNGTVLTLEALLNIADAGGSVVVGGVVYNPVRIDSPLANLAFYKDIITDGTLTDPATGAVVYAVSLDDAQKLAALFLGTASDKTMAVTPEIVHAVDVIMLLPGEEAAAPGVNPDLTQDEAMATDAEAVRSVIADWHG